MALVLRTAGAPEQLAPALRTAVAGVDPMLALDRIQSLDAFLANSLAPQKFRTTLMLGLALVGLVLGAIGIAGVTARSIAERMPEFGVRLALGCDSGALWRRAVTDQVRVVAVGAIGGVVLALAASQLLAALLPETGGIDLPVLAGAVAVLSATALVSAAIPASRVLRLNPLPCCDSRPRAAYHKGSTGPKMNAGAAKIGSMDFTPDSRRSWRTLRSS
jgi:predicted lysophospholipase L1 biosynthesis ABC-type transport system permease subunit